MSHYNSLQTIMDANDRQILCTTTMTLMLF